MGTRSRPFHRQQYRAAPFAADADPLDQTQHGQDDGTPDADLGIARHKAHGKGREAPQQQGCDRRLVFIAAHEPDAGETEASNGKRFPSATSKTNAIEKTPDGYTYLDPAAFPKAFAADLPPEQAEFEAHAQMLTAAGVFTAPVTDPAWKVKPSWALVADADEIINPDLERFYAARAHSHVVEVKGASHSVYESRPKEVAALIEEAAQHAQDQ